MKQNPFENVEMDILITKCKVEIEGMKSGVSVCQIHFWLLAKGVQ